MTVGMPDNGRRFAPVRTKYLACLYGNVYVTINQGRSLNTSTQLETRDWFESLNAQAAKVTVALTRIELGNLSNVKGVGAGVQEFRIGATAQKRWADYKKRKKG